MLSYLEHLPYFAESWAIVVLLAWCYGSVHRRAAGHPYGPIALGALFGVVAVIQMHAPIEPVEGFLIDLRVVPVVLAGAFLGSSGLLVCLIIATAARLQIGGIGMEAGVAAIVIGGLAGLFWSGITSSLPRRGILHFLALAMMASSTLVAGLLLPSGAAAWFFSTMGPVLIGIYAIIIPMVAILMERARVSLIEARDLAVAAPIDPSSGLPTKRAFARRVSGLAASRTAPRVTSVLVLQLKQKRFLQSYWGMDALGHVLSGLKLRIEGVVYHKDFVGRASDDTLLVGLTEAETRKIADVENAIGRAIADRSISLPGGDTVRITVTGRLVSLNDPLRAEAVLTDLTPKTLSPRPFLRTGPKVMRRMRNARVAAFQPSHDGLFDSLEQKMPQTARVAAGTLQRRA